MHSALSKSLLAPLQDQLDELLTSNAAQRRMLASTTVLLGSLARELENVTPPRDDTALTVDEFCAEERIGRTKFYADLKDGLGPKIQKNGTRTTITREAQAEYRANRAR
jgi:hypothetical protein